MISSQLPNFIANFLEIVKIFKSVKLFSDAKTIRLPVLIKKMTKEIYPASYCLLRQGDPIEKIYVITKGSFTIKYTYSIYKSSHFSMDNFIPIQNYSQTSFLTSRSHELKGKQLFNECEKLIIYSQGEIIGDVEWELQSSTSVFSIYSNEEGSELYSCTIEVWNKFIEKFMPLMHEITQEKMKMIQSRIDDILHNKKTFMITKQKSYYKKLADQTTVLQKINTFNKKQRSCSVDKTKRNSSNINKSTMKTRNKLLQSKNLYFELINSQKKYSKGSKNVQFYKTTSKPFIACSQLFSLPVSDNEINITPKHKNSHAMNDLFQQIRSTKYNNNHSKSFITGNSRRYSILQNQGRDNDNSQLHKIDERLSIIAKRSVSVPILAKVDNIHPMFIQKNGRINLNFDSKLVKDLFVKKDISMKLFTRNYTKNILPELSKEHMVFNPKDLLINRNKSQCLLENQYDFFRKISKFKLIK